MLVLFVDHAPFRAFASDVECIVLVHSAADVTPHAPLNTLELHTLSSCSLLLSF